MRQIICNSFDKSLRLRQGILLCSLLILSVFTAYSQDTVVQGVITDATTGQSIPGVNVIVKDSSTGTSSDMDGSYSISGISQGDVLVFSFLGFETMEITIGDDDKIDVALAPVTNQLDELVIVGYGKKKKRTCFNTNRRCYHG